MPADFYIDAPRRLVFSRGTGVLTFADCRGHMERLLGEPGFRPEFNQLIDFRDVTDVAISAEEIVLLAARNVFSPKSRRAFVVANDLQFGLARMFRSYRENAGEKGIQIFREMKEALVWLALTGMADPQPFPKVNLSARA